MSTKTDPVKSTQDNSAINSKVRTQLDRIEKHIENGDIKKACELNVSISKDTISYNKLSPELINSLQKVKVKCASLMISIGAN